MTFDLASLTATGEFTLADEDDKAPPYGLLCTNPCPGHHRCPVSKLMEDWIGPMPMVNDSQPGSKGGRLTPAQRLWNYRWHSFHGIRQTVDVEDDGPPGSTLVSATLCYDPGSWYTFMEPRCPLPDGEFPAYKGKDDSPKDGCTCNLAPTDCDMRAARAVDVNVALGVPDIKMAVRKALRGSYKGRLTSDKVIPIGTGLSLHMFVAECGPWCDGRCFDRAHCTYLLCHRQTLAYIRSYAPAEVIEQVIRGQLLGLYGDLQSASGFGIDRTAGLRYKTDMTTAAALAWSNASSLPCIKSENPPGPLGEMEYLAFRRSDVGTIFHLATSLQLFGAKFHLAVEACTGDSVAQLALNHSLYVNDAISYLGDCWWNGANYWRCIGTARRWEDIVARLLATSSALLHLRNKDSIFSMFVDSQLSHWAQQAIETRCALPINASGPGGDVDYDCPHHGTTRFCECAAELLDVAADAENLERNLLGRLSPKMRLVVRELATGTTVGRYEDLLVKYHYGLRANWRIVAQAIIGVCCFTKGGAMRRMLSGHFDRVAPLEVPNNKIP